MMIEIITPKVIEYRALGMIVGPVWTAPYIIGVTYLRCIIR